VLVNYTLEGGINLQDTIYLNEKDYPRCGKNANKANGWVVNWTGF
jgi:hypothetical protein